MKSYDCRIFRFQDYVLKFVIPLILFVLFILTAGCDRGKQTSQKEPDSSLVDVVLQGGSSIYTVPFDQYRTDLRNFPIGVFDSGIGGLTVLSEIMKIDRFNNDTQAPGPDKRPDFEAERFVYLGDQANMPYGDYPAAGKTDFLRELVLKDAVFLLGTRYWPAADASGPRNDKSPVKAIVIACNTATAYGLEDVRAALEKWKIPLYLVGVVDAGAKGAAPERKESDKSTVAVMATVGTCQSEGYVRAVEKIATEAGVEKPTIIQQGCHGLASAIEGDPAYITPSGSKPAAEYQGPSVESKAAPIDPSMIDRYAFQPDGLLGDVKDPATLKLNSVENYIRYHVTTLVENYRKSGAHKPIGTVILGCTHFPFRSKSISASFSRLREYIAPDGSHPYRDLISANIRFIDPSQLTAEQLYIALSKATLLRDTGRAPYIPTDEFYISVPNPRASRGKLTESGVFTREFKYGRETGKLKTEYELRVPMSAANLSPEVRKSIRETMPKLWDHMIRFNAESPRCKDLPEAARLKAKE